MADEQSGPVRSADYLDQAFALYIEAAESGRPPDREEFLSQYPELTRGVAAHERFDHLAAPIRELLSTIAGPSQSNAERVPPGTIIGHYVVENEIGRDGQGIVYKARSCIFKEEVVALKMLRSGARATEKEVQRFIVEVDNQAKLDHSNIVPIKGGGEHEGQLYFTMKLIEGGDLTEKMANRTMSAREAASLMLRIARAVAHAHDRGILHRDLKPSNILLDADGVPYVADFGLSKRVQGEEPTTAGYIVGAAPFIAPEQVRGETIRASDVYGLGATFYWLLTGRPPFCGETREETLRQVLQQNAERPCTLKSDVSRDLEAICLKCLEKEPGLRYASADAFAVDLEQWLAGRETSVWKWPPAYRLWRWCGRNPLGAGLTATAALLLIAVTATVILLVAAQQTRLKQEEDEFHARVKTKSVEIANQFTHVEQLIEYVRGAAEEVLVRGEPITHRPVFKGDSFHPDSAVKPPDLVRSEVHDRWVSCQHPSVVEAPDAKKIDEKTWQRVMMLTSNFQRVTARSGNSMGQPPQGDELRRLLTETGVPVAWVYLALKEGIDCTYPGTDYPDGYDPRERRWYVEAKDSNRESTWVGPYSDALGQGQVLSCSAPIHDGEGNFLGVTGFDLLESFVIREILRITKQPHVEAFLVDSRGEVLMPDASRTLPASVKEHINGKREGHIRTDDKLVAYFRLGVSDWYYVVVAASDRIQEVLDSMRGQQHGSQ